MFLSTVVVVFCVLNWEFRMSVPSILLFFVVSHLLLLHSAGCPESFDCGTHGKIQFPYTNSTYPLCGFVMVDCGKSIPKVSWGEGHSYEVSGNFPNNAIKINDLHLKDIISNKRCDIFDYNFYATPSPSISFTISPNLTLFKCNTDNHELHLPTEDYFRGNQSYRDCPGYTLYYKYPSDPVPTLGSYPSYCTVIQLPIVQPTENQEVMDLFQQLTAEFTIGLHVKEECHECLLDGVQCSEIIPEFQCTNKSEGTGNSAFLYLSAN